MKNVIQNASQSANTNSVCHSDNIDCSAREALKCGCWPHTLEGPEQNPARMNRTRLLDWIHLHVDNTSEAPPYCIPTHTAAHEGDQDLAPLTAQMHVGATS